MDLDRSIEAHVLMLDGYIIQAAEQIAQRREKEEEGISIDSQTLTTHAIESRAALNKHVSIGLNLVKAAKEQREQMKEFCEGTFSGPMCGTSKVPDNESQMVERKRQVVAKQREFGKHLHNLIEPLGKDGLNVLFDCVEAVYDFKKCTDDSLFVNGMCDWYEQNKERVHKTKDEMREL